MGTLGGVSKPSRDGTRPAEPADSPRDRPGAVMTETRRGYKQTEVGVIPEDWEAKTVGQISTVGRGRVISHREISRSRNPAYPVYSSQTSNNGVMGYLDSFDFEGEYITWTTDGANAGTVFHRHGRFNCTNVCGTIKLSSDHHVFVAKVLSRFAHLHVSRHLGNPKLMNDVMKRVKVPLPSTLAEQESIAEALSDVDALIESLEQLLTKKRQIKQGAMQELLTGKKRLQGFGGDWKACRVEDVADVKTGPFGSSLHERDYVEDGIPIITVEHLGEFGVMHANLPKVSDIDWRRLEAYTLQEYDIVFSRVGSIDRNALIRAAEVGWLFSGRLLRLRPNRERAFPPYLSYQFHTDTFKQRVKGVAVGQTMACLSTKILSGVEVLLPSVSEQTAIATILSDMDAEIATLETKLSKARQLKQGMMQELLTGRTRLV